MNAMVEELAADRAAPGLLGLAERGLLPDGLVRHGIRNRGGRDRDQRDGVRGMITDEDDRVA